ncbi:MAG TPA: GNAT family N-acetyltransferase [Thermoleophilaceae bacterium]|nr:GNAT family N-acetyltransferase [Thermoleophilaceae bacterium]
MDVIAVDPQRDRRWETFLGTRPEALVYQHPAWLRVLERTYGYEPVALAAERESGELGGVLPLVRKRGLLTGRQLSSLPHTPIAGPLAADSGTAAALVRAAVRIAGAAPGTRLQLKTTIGDLEALGEELTGVIWADAHILELPEEEGEVRFGNSRNHSRIKWAVTKAKRAGVQVRRAGSLEDLRAWYRLYVRSLRPHLLPPHPYRFFQTAWEELRPRGLMRLLLAEQSSGRREPPRLLAGALLLTFGTTVFYAFSGLLREAGSLRPNDLLQWQAIHDARDEGFRRYDLGGGLQSDAGLTAFKKKWGGHEEPRYRYYHPPEHERRGPLSRPELYREGEGRLGRLGKQTWRRLPDTARIALGQGFYRYL